jgi:hypothetical protein
MNIDRLIEDIRHQLEAIAAAGGEEAQALAARLVEPLDSAVRLAIQDALAAAAEDITIEMAPGSVELRLRGREPEFVVTLPPTEHPEGDDEGSGGRYWSQSPATGDAADDGSEISRINLRLPDRLKSRVEEAAGAEGLSVNAWLVRVVAAVVEHGPAIRNSERRTARGTQRHTGWVR